LNDRRKTCLKAPRMRTRIAETVYEKKKRNEQNGGEERKTNKGARWVSRFSCGEKEAGKVA